MNKLLDNRWINLLVIIVVAAFTAVGTLYVTDQPVEQGTTNLGTLTLSDDLTVGGNLAVTGTQAFTGATTLSGALSSGAFTGSSTGSFADEVTLSGETTFASTTLGMTTDYTLTVAATFYVITSTANVTLTLGTTGAATGQVVILYGNDANTITIADTNVRTSTGSAVTMGQYDVSMWIYNGTSWVEMLLIADS